MAKSIQEIKDDIVLKFKEKKLSIGQTLPNLWLDGYAKDFDSLEMDNLKIAIKEMLNDGIVEEEVNFTIYNLRLTDVGVDYFHSS